MFNLPLRCAFIVTLALAQGCRKESPTAHSPNNSILGKWEAVSGEAMGNKIEGREKWGMRITFADGMATWYFQTKDGWQSYDGLCRIDPEGKKGWIDLGQPKNDAKVAFGIYKIEGKTLQISMDNIRPSSFDKPALSKINFEHLN
jgi:uncharacterized protein (TIGR03067 family)